MIGQKPTPQEQSAYNNVVKQVVEFMSDPEVMDSFKKLVDANGPEKALAATISQALGHVGMAAQQSGASVSERTGKAALKEILMIFVNMLAAAGAVKDVPGTIERVMQMILGGVNGNAQ